MKKVMVIGNAGGGKSTMAKELCVILELPYYSIDEIQWKPGWIETPEEEYDKAHNAVIVQQRWLVDGYGSWGSVLKRMDAADTIVVVDLPIWLHYWWATKRQFRSLFSHLKDEPEGCRMWPKTWRLYKMMWQLHKTGRKKLLDEAATRAKDKQFEHLQSSFAIERYLNELM